MTTREDLMVVLEASVARAKAARGVPAVPLVYSPCPCSEVRRCADCGEPNMAILGSLVEEEAAAVVEALELLSSHVDREGDRLMNCGQPRERYQAFWSRSLRIHELAEEIGRLCDEAEEARA